MPVRRLAVRTALAFFVASSLLLTQPAVAAPPDTVMRAAEVTKRLTRSATARLPFAASHVAVYWTGRADAAVRLAFGRGDGRFGRMIDAGRDDLGSERGDGVTYGAIRRTSGARVVRLVTNEPVGMVTVLALADRPIRRLIGRVVPPAAPGDQRVPRPPILSRAEWGANEALRFKNGTESWPPAFAPTQKLLVHHTDTANQDPNPAATVRAIYHYHAITQDWGDIGYNFLIDEAGRIYKGRNSHAPGNDADTISGRNAHGHGVTGAHARSYNAGSVGVALLGSLTTKEPSASARQSLEALLAWEADMNGINPHGNSTYTSPVDGHQRTFANIAGHRDVGSTQCPGGALYARLPAVRDAVAERLAAA